MEKTIESLLTSIRDSENDHKCVICGKQIKGYGNNAWPVKAGDCCDDCNLEVVLPARIAGITNHKVTDSVDSIKRLIQNEVQSISLFTEVLKTSGEGTIESTTINHILEEKEKHLELLNNLLRTSQENKVEEN